MTDEIETAGRYRQHARQLRAIAEDKGLPETRKALLQIAETYESMAEGMERMDKANGAK